MSYESGLPGSLYLCSSAASAAIGARRAAFSRQNW